MPDLMQEIDAILNSGDRFIEKTLDVVVMLEKCKSALARNEKDGIYESAVRGRQEFRAAYALERKKSKACSLALEAAILLLCQWHDAASEKKAYRFDLRDHPKVSPLYAAIDSAREQGKQS